MDINYFKNKLVLEKESLEKEIASYKAKDPYLDNRQSEIFDDDVSEIEGHDRLTATLVELGQRLEEVNDALKRIEEGLYGRCVNCGQKIASERLEAMSTALLCASCQGKEKRG